MIDRPNLLICLEGGGALGPPGVGQGSAGLSSSVGQTKDNFFFYNSKRYRKIFFFRCSLKRLQRKRKARVGGCQTFGKFFFSAFLTDISYDFFSVYFTCNSFIEMAMAAGLGLSSLACARAGGADIVAVSVG